MRLLFSYLILLLCCCTIGITNGGTVKVYEESGCVVGVQTFIFSGSEICIANSVGSIKITCYNPTNNRPADQYLWPQTNNVFFNAYMDTVCSVAANVHEMGVSQPNVCLSSIKLSVSCDQYTSNRPDDSLQWYDNGNILLGISSLKSISTCPSSQSLFNIANPDYSRTIAPLDQCVLNPPTSQKNYKATKFTCTPGKNPNTDPPIVTEYRYSDGNCLSLMETRETINGCMSDDSGSPTRIQCRIGGQWTNDNFVVPSSAYHNGNIWNSLVVGGLISFIIRIIV